MKKNLMKITTIAAASAMVLSVTAIPAAAEEAAYKVGICQLVQHVALDAATLGFKDALTDALGDAVVFDEQNAAGDSATCATITNQFVADGVDLILANATPALQAAAAATNEIPILGTAVTDYATALDMDDWTGVTGTNISGTSDLAPLDQQAAMLNELFPDAKNVGVVYCSAEANSAYQADVITGYLEEKGYTVNAYTFADSNDVASVTTTACAENEVLYIPTDNTAASCTEIVKNVAVPAGVPIIAGEEGICAGCGVATLSISYYDLGYTTGQMAVKILTEGTDVSSMPIEFAPNVTKEYNADICTELGLEMPEDYIAIGAAAEAGEEETAEAETEAVTEAK
ncbi:MAG: ABC transporter substrate-binding protein [Lachnospiraceae bacterium]|nr:ABC transporter substrate-binding protein [Lachnospiraceae bacterium]